MANIFSRAWKGIKKVAKKIGKGIRSDRHDVFNALCNARTW